MTRRSADLPYKTREVAMLTSRRMLSLLLAAAAAIVLLTGCYAPASTETSAERSTQESNASSTVKLGGYPVPTENVTSGIMCACMQTQDGFWLWTMGGKQITAFERRMAQLIHPALRLAASTRIRPARRILAQLRIWPSMTAASMRLSAETISHPSLWLPDQFQAEHCRRLPAGKLRMKTQTIAVTCAAFLSERPI